MRKTAKRRRTVSRLRRIKPTITALGHRDRKSGERRRIGQMSSDAEDQLARMTLLVKVSADTQARAELFATEMRDEPAQLAAAIAALKEIRALSRVTAMPVPCTMNGSGVLQGTGRWNLPTSNFRTAGHFLLRRLADTRSSIRSIWTPRKTRLAAKMCNGILSASYGQCQTDPTVRW